MKTKKRFLSWLLVLAMVFSMVPAAMAVDTSRQSRADGKTELGGLELTASFGQLVNDQYHTTSTGDTKSAILTVNFNKTASGFTFDLLKSDLKKVVPEAADISVKSQDVVLYEDDEWYSFSLQDTPRSSATVQLRWKDADDDSLPIATRGNYPITLRWHEGVPAETGKSVFGSGSNKHQPIDVTTYLIIADANGETDLLPGEGTSPTVHAVACHNADNGTVTIAAGGETAGEGEGLAVTEGTQVAIKAVPDKGYMVSTVNGEAVEPKADGSYETTIVVTAPTDVKVKFAVDPNTKYDLTLSDNLAKAGVTFQVDGDTVNAAAAGKVVTIVVPNGIIKDMTTVPNSLVVTDMKFTMPAADVTIGGTFEATSTAKHVTLDTIGLNEEKGEAASLNGVTSVEPGTSVTVYVKLTEAETREVKVETRENAVGGATKVIENFETVTEGPFAGYRAYMFEMPDVAVTACVTFSDKEIEQPSVDGKYTIEGKVVFVDPIKGNLAGIIGNDAGKVYGAISIELRQENVANDVKASVKCASDGTFKFENIELSDSNYTLQAKLNASDEAFWADGATSKGAVITSETSTFAINDETPKTLSFEMQTSLYYDVDLDGEAPAERVFAGEDCILGTADDYYAHAKDIESAPGGYVKVSVPAGGNAENVFVHVGDDGKPGTADDYYMWLIDGKNNHADEMGNTKVFVNQDGKAGIGAGNATEINLDTEDKYRVTIKVFDAEGKIVDQEMDAYVGADNTSGTEDDRYVWDINGDGKGSEVVFAGPDGKLGTSDDYYLFDMDGDGNNDTKVFVGDDNVAGSNDDFYWVDTDGDGEDDTKVFIGLDRTPGTADDNYLSDVDGDELPERVFVGDDGKVGGTDDTYFAHIPSSKDEGEKKNEHDIANGIEYDTAEVPEDYVRVTVDPEGEDHYQLEIGGKDTTVYVGEDGEAGTEDDHYGYEIPAPGKDNREPNEVDTTVDVSVGEDGKPGSSDDTYELDVDGDGDKELIHVGEDGVPGTEDDWYEKDVNGDGENEKIFAGDDERLGDEDDYYNKDINGEDEPIHAGEDAEFGTKDDWYPGDTNGDGVEDPDKLNGDDTHDKIFAGEDGKPGTKDDFYKDDVDPDLPGDETIYVGDDTKPGTEDDWYEKDVDGDGDKEPVFPGDDKEFGTEDDYYIDDIDDDGKDEIVNVGEDKKTGTDDDNWVTDITLNANGGTVTPNVLPGNRVTKGGKILEVVEISALPTPTRSGSYSFSGWDKTIEAIKAATGDITATANWRYTGSSGGGGGGGGGGSTIRPTNPPLADPIIVTFVSNGGTPVEAQVFDKANQVATKPADPTRIGHEFQGWFLDGKAFDFKTKLTKSITLEAQWKNVGPLRDDHIDYIHGYGNGNVGPNNYMTRAEAAQVFYNLLTDEYHTRYDCTTNTFGDVDAGSWYNKAVSTLANMGVIVGYGDGNFGPGNTISRAEFATICVRLYNLTSTKATNFTDVPADAWYTKYVQAAAENGWVTGYGDGRFGPTDQITRAQVVSLLNRVLCRQPKNEASFAGLNFRNWPDNQNKETWYYLDLIEAGTAHTFEMDDSNYETWTSLLEK